MIFFISLVERSKASHRAFTHLTCSILLNILSRNASLRVDVERECLICTSGFLVLNVSSMTVARAGRQPVAYTILARRGINLPIKPPRHIQHQLLPPTHRTIRPTVQKLRLHIASFNMHQSLNMVSVVHRGAVIMAVRRTTLYGTTHRPARTFLPTVHLNLPPTPMGTRINLRPGMYRSGSAAIAERVHF